MKRIIAFVFSGLLIYARVFMIVFGMLRLDAAIEISKKLIAGTAMLIISVGLAALPTVKIVREKADIEHNYRVTALELII